MKKRLKMTDLERTTGVGREAIRYYIREGLLPEPERPGRNVAWYDESFIERIQLIKRLQQERFLPLSVIKGIVGAAAVPSPVEVQTLLALDGKLAPVSGSRAPEPLTRLAKRIGLPAAEIRELAAVGAIDVDTHAGSQSLDGRSVAIVEEWAAIRRAGFSADLGFVAADAKLYVEMIQWLVRQELRLFSSRVAGKVDGDSARDMAQRGIDRIGRLLVLLRERILLRFVAEGNVPDSANEPRKGKAVGE
jgi:DNA-binding transcriptional MerR regulator